MKIRITEPELSQIVRDHIAANVSFKDGAQPTVSFTATRGEDGIVAEIDIPYMGVSALPGIADAVPAQVDAAKAQKRAPRTTTAPSPVTKDNLFAGLTPTTPAAEDADPADAVTEAEQDTNTELDNVQDGGDTLPAAEAPKTLFGS